MSLYIAYKVCDPNIIYDSDDEPKLCIIVILKVKFQGIIKKKTFIFFQCIDGYRLKHDDLTFTMIVNDKTYFCNIFRDIGYTIENIHECCESLQEVFTEHFV
jgi:hypothetical protein